MAVFSCTCKHEFQDKTYGAGKRVFNLGKTGYKCTVCGSKKPLLGTEKKDEKIASEEKKS
jgi:hypothetical protein